jgi:hypothetical protein
MTGARVRQTELSNPYVEHLQSLEDSELIQVRVAGVSARLR